MPYMFNNILNYFSQPFWLFCNAQNFPLPKSQVGDSAENGISNLCMVINLLNLYNYIFN